MSKPYYFVFKDLLERDPAGWVCVTPAIPWHNYSEECQR